MSKTTLTLQLETDVIRRARVLAARRGTSVSALVARELTALVAREDRYVAREDRYEDARRRAIELMAAAKPRGGRSWRRDDIYAERLDRYDR
jgi:deoxyribodipyrimidine photolyase-like uncharacterized protein